ncbi:uncharacterized protein LOC106174493 [Lingula anatina]|uniref:Uncharacterized protein LOC106174493 n=1 Tax=Lingula anatina TaxID=7574 RepID=A0A1S3JMB4_LINAN|nr:uncharacterized protein LOC106174493 [Lingula anatina]|eukprot:XP_013411528.1 uncharacterized protein LOC106174493 [Lingula anatina]
MSLMCFWAVLWVFTVFQDHALADAIASCRPTTGGSSTTVRVAPEYEVPVYLAEYPAVSNLNCLAHCPSYNNCQSTYFDERAKRCYILGIQQETTGYETSSVVESGGVVTNLQAQAVNALAESTYSECANSPCSEAGRCRATCDTREVYCVGDLSDCEETPFSNIYEWTTTTSKSVGTGTAFTISYTKKKGAETGLYLKWSGTMRSAYNVAGGCTYWVFMIDGSECADPGRIRYAEYHSQARNHLKHTEFFGICNNIAAGVRSISLSTVRCSTDRSNHVGWNARSRITVAEVEYGVGSGACASLSTFNIQYLNKYRYSSTRSENVHISETFRKRASDTALVVHYSGNLYVSGSPVCSRWYFKFNGAECQNPGTVDMVFYTQGETSVHRGYAVHGLCEGLAAGTVTVSLHVGACYDSYSAGNPHTGWNQENLLIMEESRLGNDISAVLTPNGHAYRLPVVNRQHGWWLNLDNGNNNALIKAFVYNKVYTDSGINVIWSFNCRILGNPNCGRWYVTFNGTACSNPGSIERVMHEGGPSEANWLQPCVLDGICHDIPSGPTSVELRTAPCSGYSGHGMYTGWRSTTNVIVEEVFVGV